MRINITKKFQDELNEILIYIAKDKPVIARKFKKDLTEKIKKDVLNPFQFKKSIYFDDELYRDYVYKGYTIVIKVDKKRENAYLIGILKYQLSFKNDTWKPSD
jgi:hypothetical protein